MSGYAGIDYSGPGSTVNRDPETGIRYGVISQHSIQPDVMSDIWSEARDLSYEAAKEELLDTLMSSLVLDDGTVTQELLGDLSDLYCGERLDSDRADAVGEIIEVYQANIRMEPANLREAVWGVISDRFGDRYEDNGDRSWLWEKDGYSLRDCLTTDVFVTESPYFTYAQFCSPCVPGAGNLDNAIELCVCPHCGTDHVSLPVLMITPMQELRWVCEACGFEKSLGGELPNPWPRVFCLGHDFFDNEEAPYPVFSAKTGKRVVMRTQFKSVAKWPDGVGITLGNANNTSEDMHGSREAAQAVCDMLVKNGFGGDGLVFPVWTQVREEKVEVEQ